MENVGSKALASGKYLIIFGIVSSALSFFVSAILGRISSEILGQYSLVLSFLNLTTSIVCMGGATWLGRYIIREETVKNRSRLFFTYFYLTMIVFVVFSLLLLFVPSVYEMFIGEDGKNIKSLCIFVVMPIYTLVTIVSYYLVSVMEAKISKIMGNMYVLGMFFVSVISYVFFQEWFIKNFYIVTFTVVVLMNLFALFLGAFYIKKNGLLQVDRAAFKPLIYKSAVIFALCTLGQSTLSYISTNFDKIFLAKLNGMGQLGYYQAIIQIVTIVEMVPNLLGTVTIPYFSAVIEKGDYKKIQTSYAFLEKMMVLFIGFVVFGLIAIAKPVLNIFGEDYTSFFPVLVLLLASKIISSRGFLNTPMLVNLDKNVTRLVNSVTQVVLQILIMAVLIPMIGLYGAAVAKMASGIYAQIIPQVTIMRSKYKIATGKQYWCGTVCAIVLSAAILILNLNAVFTFVVSMIAFVIFWLWGGYSVKECWSFMKRFLNK